MSITMGREILIIFRPLLMMLMMEIPFLSQMVLIQEMAIVILTSRARL